jgi:hypothetical protein
MYTSPDNTFTGNWIVDIVLVVIVVGAAYPFLMTLGERYEKSKKVWQDFKRSKELRENKENQR